MRGKLREIIGGRIYVLSLAGAVVILILLRLFVLPAIDGQVQLNLAASLGQVIDSLLGATFAAIAISVLARWVIRKSQPKAPPIEMVPPSGIDSLLVDMARMARNWSYRGHTGRYFRTTVLPLLLETSHKDGHFVTVKVQILDPENARAIKFFANYRSEVNPDRVGYWTVERSTHEIAATIVALAVATARSSRFSAVLSLGEILSPFTVDLCESGALTTREKAHQDAFIYRPESTLFSSLNDDLALSARQSREIDIRTTASCAPLNETTVVHILRELKLEGLVDRIDPTAVLKLVKNPVSPYVK